MPSSGRRTGVLAAATVTGITTWTYLQIRYHPSDDGPPPILHAGPVAVWALLSAIIATVASHTIYGLRQQVRDAMRVAAEHLRVVVEPSGAAALAAVLAYGAPRGKCIAVVLSGGNVDASLFAEVLQAREKR